MASAYRLGHSEGLIAGKIHLMSFFGVFLGVGDNLVVAFAFHDETARTINYLFHGTSSRR